MATLYESITEKIIELIEEERTLPWQRPWHLRFPTNAISNRRYRGINALILASTSFSDQRWLTFRQCQELGGRIRKGERSTQITLWKFNDETVDDEKQKRVAPLVRAYSVFNVQQCEGLDLLPTVETHVSEQPLIAADQLLAGYNDGPLVIHGGSVACYIPSADRVEMPAARTFISGERYFDTLAHELIHSSGAVHRLARPGVTDPIYFHSETYALEELVAGIGAAFLCTEFGIDNTVEQSASYIDSWLDALKRDKNLIVKAAGKAQRGCDWVLNRR